MAITPPDSVEPVSKGSKRTKAIPEHNRAAFVRALREFVDKHDGNQSTAGAILGVNPGHISQLLAKKKGPGLPLLIELHKATGMSADKILGLDEDDERIARSVVDMLKRELPEVLPAPPPAPPPSRPVARRKRL